MRKTILAIGALAVTGVVAHAFCGFYVSGSDKKMFNDATQVVLMRDGTRTVLSMQNDYRGPLEDFAMVVPVPVVLKEGDVKVIEKAAFQRIDSLGSPRLVEYWEEDPCPPPVDRRYRAYPMKSAPRPSAPMMDMAPSSEGGGGGGYAKEEEARKPVPPILSSFTVAPTSITSGKATPVTWTFAFSNQPYPSPTCTVDHSVGNVYAGQQTNLTLTESTTFKLVCANAAGKSQKEARINVVKIEAQFDVAEYQILILSAKEAAGLQDWLNLNHYKIPDGAEPLLRPYIEAGMKFFVAKVDPKKVQMVDGHAALSPLRFHYDSEEFSLPIRLGMANSSGKQDLIVSILSADKRYEVANYKNVFIPTNFDVRPSVKTRFGEFYTALFDKTVEKNPGAVITEYAWTAVPNYHCDPCTDADITSPDLTTFGGDVIPKMQSGNFVLTRLHARYGKTDMKDDLRFKEASAVTGGREQWGQKGIEFGAQPSQQNFFQARYAIRHWWTGKIACKNPQRGVWGGPPDGNYGGTIAAGRTAFAPRGKMQLASVIGRDLWELGIKKAAPPPKPSPSPGQPKAMFFFGGGGFGALFLLGLVLLLRRRAHDRRNRT